MCRNIFISIIIISIIMDKFNRIYLYLIFIQHIVVGECATHNDNIKFTFFYLFSFFFYEKFISNINDKQTKNQLTVV